MEKIISSLVVFPRKSIMLDELEELLTPFVQTYEEFSKIVLELEENHQLEMVKSKGRTIRTPSLAIQYRINKSSLVSDYHQELQHYRMILQPSINIDEYYRKDPSHWQKDLPYILKIDQYIKKHSFPNEKVPAPERSFELVEDEKWIVEKGGKELLERIGIFDSFNIIPVSEPLMFAIHPLLINEKQQFHLIVENKTTYQGLLPVLTETSFSTLIYGSGKTVIKSIEQFQMQYPVAANHTFFYFGDLDKEGISIWYSLNSRRQVYLAIPFYLACLTKDAAIGKEYQRERSTALDSFLTHFSTDEQTKIRRMLGDGKYYPQEVLKTKELQQIWRESNWTAYLM